ncbi:MAG TPA: site-2 protease family protein [Candidatus Saccharimonadales bacterium]|nr:site-2 protease family protein [Candidatus Saccharimonadales bacterium]
MFAGLSPTEILVVIASIIVSLSVHEAMHGFVAHWLGDSTASDMGRLTLNPLKHIDAVTTVILPVVLILTTGQPFFAAKPVPFNPYRVKFDEFGAAMVGLAGPFTNLLLAAVGGGVFRLWADGASQGFVNGLALFILVNIGFFIFNMIPLPPLDGSRLLYAFAPEPLQNVMRAIEQMGFVAILVFMLVLFQFVAPIISNLEVDLFQLLTGVSLGS